MIRIFVAAAIAAFAFCLPVEAQQVYDWSGFYAGVHGGYAWGKASVTDDINDGVPPGPFDYKPNGIFGGGTAGVNVQLGHFVIGAEGDLGYMNLTGAGIVPSSNPIYHQDITLDGGLYGLAAGRVGFAWGRTMLYGKGGRAFYEGEAEQVTTKPGFAPTGTGTFSGWAYGGGIEHMLGDNWSLKVEYLHFAFDREQGSQTSITDDPIGHVYNNWTDLNADSVKAGISYKFGGPTFQGPMK